MSTPSQKLWSALIKADHYLAFDLLKQMNGARSFAGSDMKPLLLAPTTLREVRPNISTELACQVDALLNKLEQNINKFLDLVRAANQIKENADAKELVVQQLSLTLDEYRSAMKQISLVLPRTDNAPSHVEKTYLTHHININHVVGPVNVLSSLDQVTQSVQTAPSVSEKNKKELTTLIKQLKIHLAHVPASHVEHAEIVSEKAKAIGEELSRQKPREMMLRIEGNGLVEAAQGLAEVMPMAVSVVRQITEFVSTLIG